MENGVSVSITSDRTGQSPFYARRWMRSPGCAKDIVNKAAPAGICPL